MLRGVVELVCVAGLILPGAAHAQPALTVAAAAVLALESLVFIGVLGLSMAFVAYGRWALSPLG